MLKTTNISKIELLLLFAIGSWSVIYVKVQKFSELEKKSKDKISQWVLYDIGR